MSMDIRGEQGGDTQIRQLKELCEQADKLRAVAEDLCRELTEHIHRSHTTRKAERRRGGDRRELR